MVVKNLDEKSFDAFVKKGNVVIDFYADWCGPCKVLGPIFDEASGKIKDAKFGKVDIDKNQKLAGRFQVMSIPTLLFFKDGEQVDRHSGVMRVEEIEKKIK